jgi:C4-dicarboxylate transporter DctM subunit
MNWRWIGKSPLDAGVATLALAVMLLIPLVEIVARPMMGKGVQNASVLVQHAGLVMAMFGALVAERGQHLSHLGVLGPRVLKFAQWMAGVVTAMLAVASGQFVYSEYAAQQELAYGIPIWWIQASMPVGFCFLAIRLSVKLGNTQASKLVFGCLGLSLGWALTQLDLSASWALPIAFLVLVLMLAAGAPIFAVLGGMALTLFADEGLPLASVALSHYQITVNPSLPALPLFTLAGLIFASTGAAQRLGTVFVSLFGGGVSGTVIAATVMCSCFTALTGGSGVTILALGGLLLPLLQRTGYPQNKSISLVTSASALGVLLAPSVPLIMYAIIARVPINTMFLAGVLPAAVMVASLLLFGGYLRGDGVLAQSKAKDEILPKRRDAIWTAKWELMAPIVAIGSLTSGLATPTESAAVTALYAILTQTWMHKDLSLRSLYQCLVKTVEIIGGVMLILGMALGLTNYLVDAGVPDIATEWVQSVTQSKWVFLLALNAFLFFAGALMEIYAAIVVLVPLLLPLALSYGIDPIHFGIIFLANLEMGFLCPPAGMNLYFASAVFKQPLKTVATSVAPALLAIFAGTLVISMFPEISLALPNWLIRATP